MPEVRQLYPVECLDGSDFRAVPFGVEDVLGGGKRSPITEAFVFGVQD
jgi:hypothetical protein